MPGEDGPVGAAARFDKAVGRFLIHRTDRKDGLRPGSGDRPGSSGEDPRLAGLSCWPGLAAFRHGYERGRGRDPFGTVAEIADTTLDSLWVGDSCQVCAHSLRPGDRVRISTNPRTGARVIVHSMVTLPCDGADASSYPAGGVRSVQERFRAAVGQVLPLPRGVRVVTLTPRHYRLGDRSAWRGPRRTCMLCGHTVRLDERIVRCPCGLPREQCINAVHWDPGQGQFCYLSWTSAENWRQRCQNLAAGARG